MKLTKSQREEVRMMFGGKCAYCGCELGERGWHADHVKPVLRAKFKYDNDAHCLRPTSELYRPERDTADNLFPACAKCNNYKHAMDLETFRAQLARQVEMLRKYSANFRTAERYGMVSVVEKPIVFWFERACPMCKKCGEHPSSFEGFCVDCWPGYNLCKACGDYRCEHNAVTEDDLKDPEFTSCCCGNMECRAGFVEGSTERIINQKEFAEWRIQSQGPDLQGDSSRKDE